MEKDGGHQPVAWIQLYSWYYCWCEVEHQATTSPVLLHFRFILPCPPPFYSFVRFFFTKTEIFVLIFWILGHLRYFIFTKNMKKNNLIKLTELYVPFNRDLLHFYLFILNKSWVITFKRMWCIKFRGACWHSMVR